MVSFKHAIAFAMVGIFLAHPGLSSQVPRGNNVHSAVSARQAAPDAAATIDTLMRQRRRRRPRDPVDPAPVDPPVDTPVTPPVPTPVSPPVPTPISPPVPTPVTPPVPTPVNPPVDTPVDTPVDNLEGQARDVREQVRAAVLANPGLAAQLVRLVFHDAFTVDPASGEGGCNGSIRNELGRDENRGLRAAVNVLTRIQESAGLGWGDTIAVAGAEAVEAAGGPHIELRLGREESNGQDPTDIMPDRGSTLAVLRNLFAPRGFSDRDLVALSGAHTLGNAFGTSFVSEANRFQNE